MDRRDFAIAVEKWFGLGIQLVILLAMWCTMIALPAWLLYSLIAPLFGPDPVGHLEVVLRTTLAIAAVFGALWLILVVTAKLYARFHLVRVVLRGLGIVLLALFVLATLGRWIEGDMGDCTPSRFLDC